MLPLLYQTYTLLTLDALNPLNPLSLDACEACPGAVDVWSGGTQAVLLEGKIGRLGAFITFSVT